MTVTDSFFRFRRVAHRDTMDTPAPGSLHVGTYFAILVCIFLATPIAILLYRFYRLGQYFTADRLLRAFSKVPFERVKSLMLQNASLVKRPLNQQLEVYLYAQTSIGFILDVTQAVLSLISVALFIASSYRPPTGRLHVSMNTHTAPSAHLRSRCRARAH